MASSVKETLKVDSLGKWGPKVGNEYLSWSKKITDADKGKVVPGGTYEMDLYIADSGKRYINSVKVSGTANTTVVIQPEPLLQAVKPTHSDFGYPLKPKVAKKLDEMSKDEWAAKDRRISRQGCIQVAVQVTSNFEDAVALAEKMLGFVND